MGMLDQPQQSSPLGGMLPSLLKAGQILQGMGSGTDSLLAHIGPKEAALLKKHGGSGTINPRTGLLQFDPMGDGHDGNGDGAEGGGGAEGGNIGGHESDAGVAAHAAEAAAATGGVIGSAGGSGGGPSVGELLAATDNPNSNISISRANYDLGFSPGGALRGGLLSGLTSLGNPLSTGLGALTGGMTFGGLNAGQLASLGTAPQSSMSQNGTLTADGNIAFGGQQASQGLLGNLMGGNFGGGATTGLNAGGGFMGGPPGEGGSPGIGFAGAPAGAGAPPGVPGQQVPQSPFGAPAGLLAARAQQYPFFPQQNFDPNAYRQMWLQRQRGRGLLG